LPSKIESIIRSSAWERVKGAVEGGLAPSSVILKADEHIHLECALLFAKLFLSGKDPCEIMADDEILNKNTDPDLILSGEIDTAPGIDRCREISTELAMKPIASQGRVAVIFSADKLSLSAANSLLKVTEEPPAGASILFISSADGEMIPTLKSRSWLLSISSEHENASEPMPVSDSAWLDWLSGNEKRNIDDIIGDLEKWINYSLGERNFLLAEHLEELKMIGTTKRFSRTMLQDLILLVVKEGTPFERILGDFW